MVEAEIIVEVAYATERRQFLKAISVTKGCNVAYAICESEILNEFPDIDLGTAAVGMFGKRCQLDQLLHSGDRVEIYCPLKVDPKQLRVANAKSKTQFP